MAYEMTQRNDPEEMKKSAEESWICKLFQEHNLEPHEKKAIIKSMVADFKLAEEEAEQKRKEIANNKARCLAKY